MFIPRLISSIVLLAVLFAIIVIKGVIGLAVFTIVGVFLSIITVRELSDILCKFKLNKFNNFTEFSAVIIFLLTLLGSFYAPDFQWLVLISAIIIVICWIKTLLSVNKPDEFTKVVNFASVYTILILPLNFVTLIFTADYGITNIGVYMLLFLVLVTKAGDMGAYATGTLCSKRKGGNHPIVPTISPKKSWEGTIGGLIISVILAAALGNFYGMNLAVCIILGIVLFIGGFAGDLAESSLKRLAGIKDSGNIIPGIGGSLDLVDSLLMNAPVFYLMLLFFGIIS
ncbi:MAG TPA: hypothetical protein DD381_09575 [Lentisphaeria bacterium]|nr:MAG: hypothetical protein A2X47_07450 [Lentisphaerae bacterium GWF2_38_69]HBM16573.1 hypothetical protein [Lentisphaeria bacterium]